MRLVRLLLFLLVFLVPFSASFAQTGKIAGVVTDASTGETIPGANVAIEGTTQGAVTDADGFYTILNVRPGTYSVQASFIGYTPTTVEDVRVSAGLTSEVDFELREETVGLDEVVVAAERPIVQLDVSANVANLDPEEFEDLPVAGVSEVLDLQAGIEPGLQVRGGGLSELAFVMDGLNLRTGRDNQPFTNISYTALEEVQVQTGGFNAEYGNVRAGVINVTTKEPPRTSYTFDGMFRYTPIQDKAFNALDALPESCDYSDPTDIDPDCNTFWVRPAFDPAVAMEGTDEWDPYTARQYYGWEDGATGTAAALRAEGFDVAAEDFQEYFKYAFRKDNSIQVPDYQADVTLGGPLIPGVSQQLGDLRFLLSYRGTQTAYTLPQSRDAYDANTVQAKLTSNIRRGMKLTAHGMWATERGVVPHYDASRVTLWQGNVPNYPWQNLTPGRNIGGELEVQPLAGISDERADQVYSNATLGRGDIDHTMYGATFTHTLNASTFYEVNLQNMASKYRHHYAPLRDDSYVCPPSGVGEDGTACQPGSVVPVLWAVAGEAMTNDAVCFGGDADIAGDVDGDGNPVPDGELTPYCLGQEPLGYAAQGGNFHGIGISTGGHWNKTRDTSDVNIFTGRFDITSQLNRFLQVKSGAELILSNYDVFSQRTSQALGFFYEHHEWERSPIQGAAYAQSKLEFQGMIANVGLRLDYFNPNSEWWVFSPYDQALRGEQETLDEQLPTEDPGSKVYLSPRIGVSFPITENSKLYFNYGHFRQMLDPYSIFGVLTTPAGGVDVIGNPEHPMPQTVAYELGFDQNLFDLFLLRVSGFYRDIREQPRNVVFHSLGDVVNYRTYRPWNYEDVRGAEFTLTKNRGEWIRGFLNYTYLQTKSGNFGYANFYENSFDQLNYLRSSTDYRLDAPIAQPFARMNLMFMTPSEYGPEAGGLHPLGDWRISLLGEWRSGEQWTWYGNTANFYSELQPNVAWADFWNFDLRLTKHLNTQFANLQLFLDVDNVFNQRHLYSETAFAGGATQDFNHYMWSLHLPGDIFDDVNAVECETAGVSVEDCPIHLKQNLPGNLWIPGDDEPGDFRADDVAFQPIEAVGQQSELPAEGAVANEWYWVSETDSYVQWEGGSWQEVPSGELEQVLDDKAYIDMPNYGFNTFFNPRRFTVGLRLSF